MRIRVTAIGLLLAVMMMASVAGRASASQSSNGLAVYVGPSFVPDSGVANLFSDQLSRIDFLFYYTGDKPIKDLDKCMFTVDLPRAMKLRSTALMSGWKKPAGKFYDFPQEPVRRDGSDYTRYVVPLPGNPNMAKAEPTVGGMFGGICYNHCKLFIETAGKLPESFTIYWKVAGEPAQAEGQFPVKLFKAPRNTPNPKRIPLIAISGRITPVYWDAAETGSMVKLFREMGITHVPSANRAALLEKGLPDVWTQAGFRFYGNMMDLMRYSAADRSSLPDIRDYAVGLDGQRSKGSAWEKFHARLFCPLSTGTPGRTGFELLKKEALKHAVAGSAWIDFDMETQPWTLCFCEDCRKEFAAFAKLPYEDIARLKPVDLVMTYTDQWYRFRCRQTAVFYANLRKAVQAEYPATKISANSVLNYLEYDMGDLMGFCSFAEDPRLLDDSVDLHTIDALMGCVADPVGIDAVRRGTTGMLVGTAGCSYCVGYNHACIVGRRIQAEKLGRSLGYDRRGDLQRLGIIHSVANGAQAMRVVALEEEETLDADVALKIDDAAAILARMENYYLDWTRSNGDIEIVDLTAEPSPYRQDNSIVAGGVWRYFYDLYGPVHWSVHRQGTERVVSLFNWDPYQDKQWLIRLKGASTKDVCITDMLNNRLYALKESKTSKENIRWTRDQLERGIRITVPSAGCAILYLGKPMASRREVVSSSVREEYLQQAASLHPVVEYSWRTGKQYDLKAVALKAVQGNVRYLAPGTIPEKYLPKAGQ